MKKKILFLIHDLGPGGAEKVLVDLVNALDREKFDISLRTLFDWGPNRQSIAPDVHYSAWVPRDVPANSHWMKLWTPQQLYRKIIPEDFDIVVSFLEGPCVRVVGGCPISANQTKVVSWVHTPILNEAKFTEGFRSRREAEQCYGRADALVFVSEDVRQAFLRYFRPEKRSEVLYNIYDSQKIRSLAEQEPWPIIMNPGKLNWCGVGKLIPLKGWTRMLEIQKKLKEEGVPACFYVVGDGPQRKELERMAAELGISGSVAFTGYQENPYAYISRCVLFVCASEREGFSTAAVESLLCGTPVCTVDVGGMREILGQTNEYGVVTPNEDAALYQAVSRFLKDPDYADDYRKRAVERGQFFDKSNAVKAVEDFLLSL